MSLVCESAVTLGVVMRCSLMEDANCLTPLALAASQSCDTLLEEFVDMVNRAIRNDQYGTECTAEEGERGRKRKKEEETGRNRKNDQERRCYRMSFTYSASGFVCGVAILKLILIALAHCVDLQSLTVRR